MKIQNNNHNSSEYVIGAAVRCTMKRIDSIFDVLCTPECEGPALADARETISSFKGDIFAALVGFLDGKLTPCETLDGIDEMLSDITAVEAEVEEAVYDNCCLEKIPDYELPQLGEDDQEVIDRKLYGNAASSARSEASYWHEEFQYNRGRYNHGAYKQTHRCKAGRFAGQLTY